MVDQLALLAGLAAGILLGLAVVGIRRGATPAVAGPSRRDRRRTQAVVAPAARPAPAPVPAPPPPVRVNRPAPAAPPAAAPAARGPARLELEGGEAVALTGQEISIGRGTDQRLRVRDSKASRAHAVVRPRAKGGWELADVGSANGTTLNGHRIPDGKVAPLRDGDRIGVGQATIHYREGGGGPAAPGPERTQVL